MFNSKNTKRSLLMSALALVLCVSMLVGSTFAWFTDSVTSANNIIKSGNLDVELYYNNAETDDSVNGGWAKVNAQTNVFKLMLDFLHTETVRKRRIDIHCLKCDSPLPILALCPQRTHIMKAIAKLNENDDINEFIKIANKTRYSYYPVLDKNERCMGIIRLSDVSFSHKKNVILVDHNSYEQSVIGLEEADILEIIDHHNISNIGTTLPINFRNMAVGSSNTIIHELYSGYHSCNSLSVSFEIAASSRKANQVFLD